MAWKRFRSLTTAVLTAVLVAAGCEGSAPVPPMWSRLDVSKTFGRRIVAEPIGYSGGRYFFGGGTVPPMRLVRSAGRRPPLGSTRLWSSRDLRDWSPMSTTGLPRHVPCGSCGPKWVVAQGTQHVMLWFTGDGFRLYASADLVHWHHVFTKRNTVTFDLERTRHGFLVSSRVGPNDGPWSYSGYESPDGVRWKSARPVAPPRASGLPAGAQLGRRFYTIDKSLPAVGRVMVSDDQRVWNPVAGATVDIERGPIASRRRDLLVAEAFDHAHQDTALGRVVTSTDAVHWREPANFRRRFSKLDVTRVGRVGAWWVGTGMVGRTTEQNRRWVAFATHDLERGPWIERRLAHRSSSWHVISAGAAAFFVGPNGDVVVFRPPR